jgi:gluconolactonase
LLYDKRHPDFDAVLQPDAQLAQLAAGYEFVEGPAWHPGEQHLIFSDIAGNTMYRWAFGAEAPSVFRTPSNKANGNTYDAEGRLLTCEHATSRVVRMELDGRVNVLASHHGEKELNSPNDIIVTRDGTIWFTDPLPGRKPFFGVPRDQELDFQGVWRLPPGADVAEPMLRDFTLPNGLCTDPDETVLYVNDTPEGHIRRFVLNTDGSLSGGEVFAHLEGEGEGVPDGLKTDRDGRVWCTGPGGVHVFSSDGTPLGVIKIPEKTANFTWMGPDRKTLVTTSSTSLYALPVAVTGHHLF